MVLFFDESIIAKVPPLPPLQLKHLTPPSIYHVFFIFVHVATFVHVHSPTLAAFDLIQLNRSAFVWSRDTPFLDDKSFALTKTFVAETADPTGLPKGAYPLTSDTTTTTHHNHYLPALLSSDLNSRPCHC